MPEHFADRLTEAVRRKGAPVCVGLDPVLSRLPAELRGADPVGAIEAFCREVLAAVAPHVPAVKPQSACFERYGAEGVAAYERVVAEARAAGLIVIGDVKRNDIGSTAEHYAAGHLGRDESPDAITVNGYLGADGIEPFVKVAAATGRGLFVLVRTSNPSAAAVQDFRDETGRRFFERLAEQVSGIGSGEGLLGRCGYSCVGAVVGATYPDEARALRQLMPRQVFLVPGYGAQGATARDCAAAFQPDGTGAVVNASRSVLYAYQDKAQAGLPWQEAIAQAARAFREEIRRAILD